MNTAARRSEILHSVPADNQLAGDLADTRRDALYRALSYLAARGGPPIRGDPADPATLRAQREAMRAWWLASPQAAALAHDYLCHCAQWSPQFKD